MGEFYFFYPRRQLSSALARRAFVARNMRAPVASTARVERISETRNLLAVRTPTNESGALYVPNIDGDGCFFFASTELLTCSNRPRPLYLELSRGSLSRILRKLSDWEYVGFRPERALAQATRRSIARFARLLASDYDALDFDDRTLNFYGELGELSRRVNEQFLNKVLAARRNLAEPWRTNFGFCAPFDYPWFETYDACFSGRRPKIDRVFQSYNPEFGWADVEREPGVYDWSPLEAARQYAQERDLSLVLGPLARWGERPPEFARRMNERDAVAAFKRYIFALIEQDAGRTKRWIVAANVESALDVPPIETRLALAAQTAFAIRGRNPRAEVFLGFEQPFGDAALSGAPVLSPLELATKVARRNLFDGFYLELNFGLSSRETLPRDPMELHSFFDRWCALSAKLCVGTSCPSSISKRLAQEEYPRSEEPRRESSFFSFFRKKEDSFELSPDDLLTAAPEDDSLELDVWNEKNQRETIRRFITTALSRHSVDEILWTRWRDCPRRAEDTTHITTGLSDDEATDPSELAPLPPDDLAKNLGARKGKSSLAEFDPRDPERFPTSGLFDENGAPKPTLHKLAAMRRAYID